MSDVRDASSSGRTPIVLAVLLAATVAGCGSGAVGLSGAQASALRATLARARIDAARGDRPATIAALLAFRRQVAALAARGELDRSRARLLLADAAGAEP